MSEEQIRAVGIALLPYLRNDLTDVELGTAAHDAVAALNQVPIKFLDANAVDAIHSATIEEQAAEIDRLRAENEELREALETVLRHVPGQYEVLVWDKARAILAKTAKEGE